MKHISLGELKEIGAITAIQDGNHGEKHPVSADYVDDGVPFIMASDIVDGQIDFKQCKKISRAQADTLRIGFSKTGDVLLTHKGTLGNVAIVPKVDPYIMLTPQVTYYRTNEDLLHNRFLVYAFREPSFQGRMKRFSDQSTRPYVGITNQRYLKIPFPPLHTQQKIAAILAAYDDLIENNLKRIKLLEEMAQITYEEWFVRLRSPGHESTTINPETGLPKGWQSISCYDAMEVMSGGTPKTSVEEYWNGNIPFYTPKDAVDSSYVFETEKYVTELGVKKCNSKLYPKDTVFITARGTVGKVNLAGQPMAMNQSCYALAGKEGISTYFLFFAVKASVEAFKGASNGGVFNTIVVDTFRYLPFTKPTPALMKKFEGFVSPILAEVSNLTQQNQRLREARDILLPRLMTGVIDVENYDPAQLLKEAA